MTAQTYTFRVHIGAEPGAVYAALTDAAALRAWLAEHAEVSLPSGERALGYSSSGAGTRPRANGAVSGCSAPSRAGGWPSPGRCRAPRPRSTSRSSPRTAAPWPRSPTPACRRAPPVTRTGSVTC